MNGLVSCPKCNGSGYIACFSHIAAGICFACHGSGQLQKNAQLIEAHDDWYRVEAMKGCNRIIVLKYKSKNIESATQRAQELIARDRHKLKHKGVDWASWKVL